MQLDLTIPSFAARFFTVILATLVASGPIAAATECADGKIGIRGEWGTAVFSVEVADTPAERSRGLQFREELPQTAGMLFLFEEPGPVTFWMKNTPLPLDMLFISKTGTVTGIYRNATPFDTRMIFGGNEVSAVLEINGGTSTRFGITGGSEILHPAFDPEIAAWPCNSTGSASNPDE